MLYVYVVEIKLTVFKTILSLTLSKGKENHFYINQFSKKGKNITGS